jgi:hypothetical protein
MKTILILKIKFNFENSIITLLMYALTFKYSRPLWWRDLRPGSVTARLQELGGSNPARLMDVSLL